jgi:hypothetical protein
LTAFTRVRRAGAAGTGFGTDDSPSTRWRSACSATTLGPTRASA